MLLVPSYLQFSITRNKILGLQETLRWDHTNLIEVNEKQIFLYFLKSTSEADYPVTSVPPSGQPSSLILHLLSFACMDVKNSCPSPIYTKRKCQADSSIKNRFGNNRDLQSSTCNHGEPSANPLKQRRGISFIEGKRRLGGLSPCCALPQTQNMRDPPF